MRTGLTITDDDAKKMDEAIMRENIKLDLLLEFVRNDEQLDLIRKDGGITYSDGTTIEKTEKTLMTDAIKLLDAMGNSQIPFEKILDAKKRFDERYERHYGTAFDPMVGPDYTQEINMIGIAKEQIDAGMKPDDYSGKNAETMLGDKPFAKTIASNILKYGSRLSELQTEYSYGDKKVSEFESEDEWNKSYKKESKIPRELFETGMSEYAQARIDKFRLEKMQNTERQINHSSETGV